MLERVMCAKHECEGQLAGERERQEQHLPNEHAGVLAFHDQILGSVREALAAAEECDRIRAVVNERFGLRST